MSIFHFWIKSSILLRILKWKFSFQNLLLYTLLFGFHFRKQSTIFTYLLWFCHKTRLKFAYMEIALEKVREKSRECHNHKPQPFPDPKRKRKPTNTLKLFCWVYFVYTLSYLEIWPEMNLTLPVIIWPAAAQQCSYFHYSRVSACILRSETGSLKLNIYF